MTGAHILIALGFLGAGSWAGVQIGTQLFRDVRPYSRGDEQ